MTDKISLNETLRILFEGNNLSVKKHVHQRRLPYLVKIKLKLIISIEHHPLDLAFKSPIIIERNRLLYNNASKFNFRFDSNVLNSSWLG